MESKGVVKRLGALVGILLVLYLAISLLPKNGVFSLSAGNDLEAEKIKESITLYNKIFTDIYVTNGHPLRLNDLPSNKQLRHEMYADIGFLRDHDMLLVYDMASLEFREILRKSPLTAEVTTFEEWNYLYKSLSTGSVAQSIKGLGQGFRYYLSKAADKWIVVEVLPVDISIPERKHEFFF